MTKNLIHKTCPAENRKSCENCLDTKFGALTMFPARRKRLDPIRLFRPRIKVVSKTQGGTLHHTTPHPFNSCFSPLQLRRTNNFFHSLSPNCPLRQIPTTHPTGFPPPPLFCSPAATSSSHGSATCFNGVTPPASTPLAMNCVPSSRVSAVHVRACLGWSKRCFI